MSLRFSGKPVPFRIGQDNKTKRSQKQENRIAKITGGRRQPRSGAIPMIPGDVEGQAFSCPITPVLIEAKTTKGKSHSVSIAKLRKITEEAARLGKRPAYWITFENMPHPFSNDWVVVPADVFDWEAE